MTAPNTHQVQRPLSSPWIWLVPAVTLLAAAAMVLFDVNQSLFLQLNSWGRSALGTMAWANATILGDTLVAFSLLGLFARKRPDIVWALLLAALFATAWVHLLKPLFDHSRPLAALGADIVNVIGVELHRNSFPSGHTTTAFTLAAIICLRGVHPALAISVLLLASLAGISRAVVGAHWPLDILAGAFGGWMAAVIGVTLGNRWAVPVGRLAQTLIGGVLLACGLTLLFWHDVQYPAIELQMGIATISVLSIGGCLVGLWRR
ncbi:phosphatase PAP2 family protein [Beggiatoa alba]|nr:phosphatase PAP2 family protein [Beggiatoa alba]